MNKKTTKQLILTALFAALIFLATTFFRINLAPRTMVHLGNAMVAVSFFVLGTKHAMIAATVGFGIYDLLNGYLSSVHFTILESLIVVFVMGVVYRTLNEKDTVANVAILGVVAAIVKMIVIFIRHYLTYQFTVGNDTVLTLTLTRMTNTFITSGVTALTVPLLYFAIKPLLKNLK